MEQAASSNPTWHLPSELESTTRELPVPSETWQDFLRRVPGDMNASQRQSTPQRVGTREWLPGWSDPHGNNVRRPPITFSPYSGSQHRYGGQRPHAASASQVSNRRPSQSHSRPRTFEVNRPLPRLPSFGLHEERRSEEYVVPPWQPDAEVSDCPICLRAFTFFFRKHHCRKCGRVVCANCSPHRITIPRQFIVHPPNEYEADTQENAVDIIDLTGDDETSNRTRGTRALDRSDAALGGGQEVRLCNPCVPDPNPLPPPSYFPSASRGPASFLPAYPWPDSQDSTQSTHWSTELSKYAWSSLKSCLPSTDSVS